MCVLIPRYVSSFIKPPKETAAFRLRRNLESCVSTINTSCYIDQKPETPGAESEESSGTGRREVPDVGDRQCCGLLEPGYRYASDGAIVRQARRQCLGNLPRKIDSRFTQLYSFHRLSIDFSVLLFSRGAHQGSQSSPITMPQRSLEIHTHNI